MLDELGLNLSTEVWGLTLVSGYINMAAKYLLLWKTLVRDYLWVICFLRNSERSHFRFHILSGPQKCP